MRRFSLAGLAALTIAFSSLPGNSQANPSTEKGRSPSPAREWVRAAIDRMGGEEKLRGLQAIEITGIRHTNLLEQSERPEGPWIVNYEEFKELRDLRGGRLRETVRNKAFFAPEWTPSSTTIVADGIAATENNGRVGPGDPGKPQHAVESIALGPERALLAALDAADLKAGTDTTLQGTRQHTAAFGWHGRRIRLYLSAESAMLTATEITSDYPQDLFFGDWGDVRKRIYFSTWYLEPEGFRYPRQWDVEINGQPLQSIALTKVDFHPPVANGVFDISADVKANFAKQKVAINDLPLGWRARKQPEELAKDFVQIPGAWNIAIVKQSDGIVILEAPISTGYSARVLEEVAKRFPGVSVKAVITTSDSWPHIGGLREYVARGIPIYALDHNRPILERMIAAPHTLNPDALERKPQKPKLTFVTQRTSLGAGPNRMELIPVRSETGERMMMVFFPEHSVLYASDLIQRQGDGSWWMPEYLLEVREAAEREKLRVEKVFAMHLTPTSWSEVLAGIEKAKAAEKTGQK